MRPPSLTHSLTHSLTATLSQSVSQSLTHSVAGWLPANTLAFDLVVLPLLGSCGGIRNINALLYQSKATTSLRPSIPPSVRRFVCRPFVRRFRRPFVDSSAVRSFVDSSAVCSFVDSAVRSSIDSIQYFSTRVLYSCIITHHCQSSAAVAGNFKPLVLRALVRFQILSIVFHRV